MTSRSTCYLDEKHEVGADKERASSRDIDQLSSRLCPMFFMQDWSTWGS